MMIKDKITAVLKELGDAPGAIIAAYNNRKAQRRELLEGKKEEARQNYEDMTNSISASSKLQELNSKSDLASKGLSRSGESVQAKLLNDMSTKSALSNANTQYRSEVKKLEDEHTQDQLNAEEELREELSRANDRILKAAEDEREAELERERLELEKNNSEEKNRIERDKLELQKELKDKELELEREKLDVDKSTEAKRLKKIIEQYEDDIAALEDSISIYEGKEALDYDTVYKPDSSAMELYGRILDESKEGVDLWGEPDSDAYEKKVREKLEKVLSDSSLDDEYKAAIRLYARIGGFLD